MKKEKIFNWMKYPPMFRLYEQAQTAKSDLEIDIEFLSDPYLGRYPEDKLNKLELPETIYSFLNQIGLPDRFSTWRSPDEEIDDKSQDTYLGVVFSLSIVESFLSLEKTGILTDTASSTMIYGLGGKLRIALTT